MKVSLPEQLKDFVDERAKLRACAGGGGLAARRIGRWRLLREAAQLIADRRVDQSSTVNAETTPFGRHLLQNTL